MMAFTFFSFPGFPFYVTQHLFRRPEKATRYMKGALAVHFMSLNRSSQALHSMSLNDNIFSCCSVSWVPMIAALKSFSFPYDAITGNSRIYYTANEICMVSTDSQQCLRNITPWKEY
ncbi:uncharacterized protein DS421_3g91550 [Arachis hypogaea]|nr:uncharacterized protein DS421_3g91550 [Arachis hypogaea]